MSALPPEARDRVLRSDDGSQVPFSELWAEGPVVVVFLRHFG